MSLLQPAESGRNRPSERRTDLDGDHRMVVENDRIGIPSVGRVAHEGPHLLPGPYGIRGNVLAGQRLPPHGEELPQSGRDGMRRLDMDDAAAVVRVDPVQAEM